MRSVDKPTNRSIRVLFVLLCCSLLVAACGGDATTPEERATEFWEAVVSGDREAALASVDPASLASGDANVFGRAHTLEDQFDWYEAVGWQWDFDGCVEADADIVECTATASNAWSDALDIDPIAGTFEMRFSEDGISAIRDQFGSFITKWSPQVFEIFASWVASNYPEDADAMFDPSTDVNPEILDLYRTNSERFVEGQSASAWQSYRLAPWPYYPGILNRERRR